MMQAGSIYGEALYSLAREEASEEIIHSQLNTVNGYFQLVPDFVRLLSTPSLAKTERCQIIDRCFRSSAHPYMLNFLKILTEKGYIRLFPDCVEAYTALYNRDYGILPVTAVTAVSMTPAQKEQLTQKLSRITGKRVTLTNQLDPKIIGGIRVDYDSKCTDDTIAYRLIAIRSRMKSTLL